MKINFYPGIFFILLLALATKNVSAQKFDSVLKKLDTEYPQEKIYVQFDKTLYNPGETIWFKAYVFAGSDLSLISKTLYADLLDEQGKIIDHKTAPLLESTAASSFDIPATVQGSQLFIKVYTKWMLNFDSSFLFTKTIPLLNTKKTTAKAVIVSPKYYLQFFPEGGDLVENVESRIAFKATDAKGYPAKVIADITDSKGKKIISFSSVHDGMGVFYFTPLPGEQYKAAWKDDAGISHVSFLPEAKKSGLVLSIKNSGSALDFTIRHSENSVDEFKNCYIVAQTNQQLLYKAKANLLKGPLVTASIPLENVPAGIVQVTLFSEDEKPLAERIAFVNQQDYYFITDLNMPQKDLTRRGKNVIQIDVPDTLHCNLSIAVTDADLSPFQPGDDNIFSHLLLTGDIKGFVYNPAYYFSSEADSVIQNLDLVMMTNGWRRFKWTDVLSDHYPVIKYKPDNYITIQGKVLGLNSTELSNRDLTAILQLKNLKKEFMSIPVNKDGTFTSAELLFYDTAHMYYQFSNDKYKTLTSKANFSINNGFLKMPPNQKPDSGWFLTAKKADTSLILKNKKVFENYLDQLKDEKVKTLTTVNITAKAKSKKDKMEEEYTSGLFSGGDATTLVIEDDPSATAALTVLNYLQGRVAGLQINMSGADGPSLSWRGGTPGLYIDEISSDVDQVQTISMNDVAMIKIFRPPFLGGFNGSGGAIAVYLKKGASRNGQVKGLDYANISGYSVVKEFYSPDYGNPDEAFNSNDFRTTLYWKPFVVTDKLHRRILLPFYNNDITKKFRVVIEGINEIGKLTHIEKIIQ